MTKVNPNYGDERKSDIFPRDIFKSANIPFLSKNIKVFQWLSKSKFFSFTTKVNPNDRNAEKSDIFPWGIFKSDTIYFLSKILKYFNGFQNRNFSVLLLTLT